MQINTDMPLMMADFCKNAAFSAISLTLLDITD